MLCVLVLNLVNSFIIIVVKPPIVIYMGEDKHES